MYLNKRYKLVYFGRFGGHLLRLRSRRPVISTTLRSDQAERPGSGESHQRHVPETVRFYLLLLLLLRLVVLPSRVPRLSTGLSGIVRSFGAISAIIYILLCIYHLSEIAVEIELLIEVMSLFNEE
jgi:hypothetical protein